MLKILVGMSLFTFTVDATIQTASTLDPIVQEIEKSPQESLVLLDIAGTLIASPDAIFHTAHEAWRTKWFQTHYPSASLVELVTIVEHGTKNWKLLEERWPELVQTWQKQGLKVVALTKATLGANLTGTRVDKLRSVGIYLNDDFPELTSGQHYVYGSGVIETDAPLKGAVLKEVLSQLSGIPEKIIFVDDRIEQIQSVHETCKELGIPCMAFHYIAWGEKTPSLNEKLAHKQLSILVNEKRWIPEAELAIVD